MKRIIVLIFLVFLMGAAAAQTPDRLHTETVWRVNIVNPGGEGEWPTGRFLTFSAGLGIGYNGAAPNISHTSSGFQYLIAPFLDLEEKWFYNLRKRGQKGRPISHNSGNFLMLRLLTTGPTISSNFERTSSYSFSVGPYWGIQRHYGIFHFLVDVGPIYYFDTHGHSGVYPLMIELNIGFDLSK